jgi:hypothetical protein
MMTNLENHYKIGLKKMLNLRNICKMKNKKD